MAGSHLSFSEAVESVRRLVQPLGKSKWVVLEKAAGYALAQSVIATEPNPRFDNSAVDGYAVGSAADATPGTLLDLQGAVAAGEPRTVPISPGCAVRILTGAPTPPGAYGIAMQEDVESVASGIILRRQVDPGDYIRREGMDFRAGDSVAKAGSVIDSGTAAQLAFVGLMTPCVTDVPSVGIVTTGDELVDPTVQPSGSQIRDTNSVMLRHQARQTCPCDPMLMRVSDDRQSLRSCLAEGSAKHDLLILSGGASVGDRDYVAEAVRELGTVFFHGVSMRPGKPVLFGKIADCFVFGLPGNPASAFVCFELFVREAMQRLAGWSEPGLLWTEEVIAFDHPACGREDFVRVRLANGLLESSGNQGSFGIRSLAHAHGLARFPAHEDLAAGDRCPVAWLK